MFGVFLCLQAARVWILLSQGRRWTTHVIVLPGAPFLTAGPYRWVRHSNYMVVVCEIAILPFIFGAIWIALIFSALNGLMPWHRICVENTALAGA